MRFHFGIAVAMTGTRFDLPSVEWIQYVAVLLLLSRGWRNPTCNLQQEEDIRENEKTCRNDTFFARGSIATPAIT